MLDTRKWLDQYSETISVGSVTSAKLASKIEANSEDDLILTPKSVKFYRRHFLGEFFFDLLALATAGLSLLFCKWYLEFHVRLRYRETDDQDPLAEVALITSLDDTLDLVQILTFDESGGKYHNEWVENRPHVAAHGRLRMFLWRQERFWNIQEGKEAGSTMWVRRAFKHDRPYNELHHIAAERAIDRLDLNLETKKMIRLTTYGENVTEIVVPPFYKMVITEALKPFFIFQLMSICVWFAQEYYIYTYSVIFMTMYSILANSYSEWKNLQALKAIAKSDSSIEKVRISTSSPRVLQTESVSTSSLLPGDLVRVTSNMILPCDVLLIMGNALLSEAMLTGESAPVMKYALPANDGDSCFRPDAERDKKYILYSGTKVLQAKCSAPPFSKDPVPLEDVKNIWEFREDSKSQVFPVAMVLKTGFSTARGQLIRAIMYPKPPKFDFEKQGYRFIWVLVGFLVVGCTVQIIVYAKHRESVKTTILDLLNLVTVAVPPALPLSLSIGLQVSYNRLKNKGIFCSHNRAVAAAGRINCLCFDKTGTLTEDGLTLKGVHVVEPNGKLGEPIERSDDLYKVESGKGHEMSNHRLMALVMAACHSVSILEPEDLPQPTKSVSKNGSDSPTPTTEMNTCDMDESGIKLLTFKALKRKLTGGKSGFQHESLDDSAHLTNPSMSFKERFVGDSLEVQMFLHSGWRYVPRPAQGQQVMKSQGQWDSSVVWSRGDVDQMVDTVLLPPMMISEEPTSFALSVLRRLDFDADLRRMGVVVQRLHSKAGRVLDNGKVLLVLKGAPEGMLDICKPDTIPSNFHERLDQLAGEGFRVLGCAARWMDKAEAETASRLDIEKGMTFLGFMSMENPLKKETVRFLKLYSYAAMRICMITGDNPQTAAAVGRMAGTFINEKSTTTLLVDFENKALTLTSMTDSTVKFPLLSYLLAHFNEDEILIPPKFNPFFPKGNQAVSLGPHDLVVTGKAFEVLLKASTNSRKDEKVDGVHWTPLELVLSKANIYARMSPQHKQDLVNALQDMNLVVAMTGDGANDSQALKAADIGISIAAKEAVDLDSSGAGNISKEEAAALAAPSIAAPFATGVHHIGAVSMVLTEGRCALLTSVTMFKYMFLYGLIQFTGVMILYYLLLELTDSQYLWADMGVVLGFVTLVPMMEPKLYIQRQRPETNLVSWTILRSIFGHAAIVVAFQILQQVMLAAQPWYEQSDIEKAFGYDAIPATVESTSKFIFSNYQYIFCCLALTQTFGLFRTPVYKNKWLFAYFVYQFIMSTTLCFSGSPALDTAFRMTDIPMDYRTKLFFLAIFNGVVALLYERFCVPHQSDDEEPVEEVPTGIQNNPLQRMGMSDRTCAVLDQQPTVLPKLRQAPPIYYQVMLSWNRQVIREPQV